jgi:hypothetical protein
MYLSLKHLKTLLPLLGLLFLNSSCSSISSRSDQEVPKGMTSFVGGKFDASGVADVPGTDGILFVDNGREGQVFWMELDQKGKQVGSINGLTLGVNIEDLEGITTDGTSFYVVSSQSRPKAIATEGLVRFKFDNRSHSIKDAESISRLKKFLVENVAELRQDAEKTGKDGGLNIEGLAWDARRGRLLLGLRSPIVNGHALVVPLRLRDQGGAFSIENLEVENPKAISLPLGGVGIRSIEYDARAKVFRIISGAAENQDQTDFGLWEWNGDEQQPKVRETKRFDKNLKPEGVARATSRNRDFLIVVFDASGYTILE